MSDYYEGQTATSKDGKSQMVYKKGMWVRDTAYQPAAAQKQKTSADDVKYLKGLNDTASASGDFARMATQAAPAIQKFGPSGTGPLTAGFLDAITPDEGGGVMDTVGATLGTLFRPLISDQTWKARDQLRSLSAQVALKGSQMMKGSSSDKDTAIMKTAGISPYKTVPENQRLVHEARYAAGLDQARSIAAARWVARNGSIAAPAKNGMTFPQFTKSVEDNYARLVAQRSRQMPSAPPRRGITTTIDLDGNPIR